MIDKSYLSCHGEDDMLGLSTIAYMYILGNLNYFLSMNKYVFYCKHKDGRAFLCNWNMINNKSPKLCFDATHDIAICTEQYKLLQIVLNSWKAI